MLYTVPDYYKQFSCIADRCEDTCCAGWQIMIDKESLEIYRNVSGSFGRRLKKGIDWQAGAFRQTEDKRCVFLNEDNLCDIYGCLGKEKLCRTCLRYPRHIEEFENVREISLSVSCPEVARILMSREEPVTFRNEEQPGDEEFEDFDVLFYDLLADARRSIFRIVQNREEELSIRLSRVLGLAREIQKRIDSDAFFECRQVIKDCEQKEAVFCGPVCRSRRYALSKSMFAKLHRFEKLRDDWEPYLWEVQALLFTPEGVARYEENRRRFVHWEKESGVNWEIKAEQLLVYFVYTYFCGAVYDGKIYEKIQTAVIHVFLIHEMLFARWIKNEGVLDQEDVVETVYRYSREIEHSDANLKLAEWLFRFS